MNNYTWEYINKHPKETKRLLGVDYQQLQNLIEYLKQLKENQEIEQEKNKIRIIKSGGGRKVKLSIEEQIILTLIYLRHHLNFQLLSLIFKISESSAHNIFNEWQTLLQSALPSSLLEQVKKLEENEEYVQEKLTEYTLIVDSEEQSIQRSQSYEEQKKYYSGKKKTHTYKNQIICLPQGKDIIHVIAEEAGRISDINIFRNSLKDFAQNQTFIGDKAYVGESQIITPKKKPKNGELTEEEKINNREKSSQRIFVEHLIRIIKIFSVMRERFRLNKSRYESIVLTVCGLVRLRISSSSINKIKYNTDQENYSFFLSHIFSPELNFDSITTTN